MTSFIEILKANLVGKKLKHKNIYYRDVCLEIENVEIKKNHRQITPDTPANDWWGESCDWDTILITFVDGSSKEFSISGELELQ